MNTPIKNAFVAAMGLLAAVGVTAKKATAADLTPAPLVYKAPPAPAVVNDDFSFFLTEASFNAGKGLFLGTFRSSNIFSQQQHFKIYDKCGCYLDFDNLSESWFTKQPYAKSVLSEVGVGIGLAGLDTVERKLLGSSVPALLVRGGIEAGLSAAATYWLVKDTTSIEVQNWNFTIDQHPLPVSDVTATMPTHNMKAVWISAGLGFASPAFSEKLHEFVVQPTLGGVKGIWTHSLNPK